MKFYKYTLSLIVFLLFFTVCNYTSASTIVRAPNNTGLVGYWNFDVEAGGSTVYDMSGQGNNGTMTNMDTSTDWVDGKIGSGALSFDGVNDYVDAGPASIPSGSSSRTISLWFNRTSQVGSYDLIFSTGFEGIGNAFGIGINVNKVGVFGWGSVGTEDYYPFTISSGQWYHIVGQYDGTDEIVYVNGNYIGQLTTASPLNTTGSNLKFGISPAGGSFKYNGLIDDVRIYNRALSAEEIKRLYDLGR